VERAAAAGASPNTIKIFDVDDLFDPLNMRGQRATVGFARSGFAGARRYLFTGGHGQRHLDILQAKLELFGTGARSGGAERLQ
jgi:hypothetical protein